MGISARDAVYIALAVGCQTCKSERIMSVYAKASDLHMVQMVNTHQEHDGYLPEDLGIGGGDEVQFTYCLDCGQIQGDFPLDETDLEAGTSDDDEDDDIYR